MKKYEDVVLDRNGNVVDGATVTVTDYPGGATSVVYATDAIGTNANPVSTGADGKFSFYAKDGRYTLTIAKTGITTIVIPNVLIQDTQGWVSVKGFGALGDGVTDDTAAFQAAANFSQVVFVPYSASAYKLNSNVAATGKHFILFGTLSGSGVLTGAKVTTFDSATGLSTSGTNPGFTYTGAGAGAVARQLNIRLGDSISVKDFGATGDGITDDTAALQAAINAVQGSSNALFLNKGNYLITTSLSVTASLTLYGAGVYASKFTLNSTTQSGIVITTTGKIHFSKFQVTGKSNATAGSLISLASGSGSDLNQFSVFTDLAFQGGWDQFVTISASGWSCTGCLFFSPLNRGVTISNNVITDAGDMQIIGCVFSGQPAVGTAIFQDSAGGLRLVGNKIIQFANGYVLSLASGVATSVLFISANSMEAFSGATISLGRGAGVVFGAVQIVGNELSGGYVGINMISDTTTWMSHMEITGNNIGTSTGGTGIVIQGTTDFIVSGNTIGGTAASGTGINIGTRADYGIIVNNTILNYALPINSAYTGSTLRIVGNTGYNPVGAAAVTTGASPWQHINAQSPATLYLSASTSITACTVNGASILPAATAAGVTLSVSLGPNEVAVVTYTGTLTARKMVH